MKLYWVMVSLFVTASIGHSQGGKPAAENKQVKLSEIREIIKIKRIAEEAKTGASVVADAIIKASLDAKMSPNTTVAQAAELEKAKGRMVVMFNSLLKTEDLVEKIVPLYDRYFTQSEIHWLLNFYQTSLGQKELTNGVPQIMKSDYKVIAEVWIKGAASQFAARVQEGLKNRKPANAPGTNL